MEENFLVWHELKSSIDNQDNGLLFNEQEIWWCSLGKNIGVEENGKNENFSRPVLIIKKFNKDMFWGVPLTSKNKVGRYYYNIIFNGKHSTALLSQMRLLSGKRLTRKIGKIKNIQFEERKRGIIEILKTNPPQIVSAGDL